MDSLALSDDEEMVVVEFPNCKQQWVGLLWGWGGQSVKHPGWMDGKSNCERKMINNGSTRSNFELYISSLCDV